MQEHDASAYGQHIADFYDELYDAVEETDEAVALITELAGAGPILEFGIGTGRLALPLAARGIDVHGIDASEEMVARLRDKPGGASIPVTVGDFVDTQADGTFSLVLLAFNAIFAPLSQEEQVRTLQNGAAHLAPGGRIVVEAFVPDPARHRDAVYPRLVGPHRVELQVMKHNPLEQRLEAVLVRLTPQGTWLFPASHRYASPSELDLMARLVGCELSDRWGGWKRQPFTAASSKHVSVYKRSEER